MTASSLHSNGDDRVRVACRIKPQGPGASSSRTYTSVSTRDQRTVVWAGDRGNGGLSMKHFTFDYAAGEDVGQEELFEKIGRPVTNACLEGFNGTIFCYGQTGSGKTYTTFGPPEEGSSPFVNGKGENGRGEGTPQEEVNNFPGLPYGDNRGLAPRALESLFDHLSKDRTGSTKPTRGEDTSGLGAFEVQSCRCSFYEIYDERVYDLIVPKKKRPSLNVREAAGEGIFLEGLSEIEVNTAREACEVLARGHASRHIASTAMNSASSRSHAIFTLVMDTTTYLPGPQPKGGAELMGGKGDGSVRVRSARFNVVDLAGSERQSRTHADNRLLKDAASINKSLSALGRVINSLVEGAGTGHVPYRDSKLTRLLAHSLGGNSKTVLVATISGDVVNAGETLSTLKFVQRAKNIKTRTVRNEATYGVFLRRPRQENEGLKRHVAGQAFAEKKCRPTDVGIVSPLQVQDKTSSPERVEGRVYRSRRSRRHSRRRMNSRTPERNRWQRRTRYHSGASDAPRYVGGEEADVEEGQEGGDKYGGTPSSEVLDHREQVIAVSTQGLPGTIDGKRVDGETSGITVGGDVSPSTPACFIRIDKTNMGIRRELELTPALPVSMAGHFLPSDSDSYLDSDSEMIEMETKINKPGVKHELRTALALPSMSSEGHFLPSDSDSDSDSDLEWESDSESAAGARDGSKGPQTSVCEWLLAGVKRMLPSKRTKTNGRTEACLRRSLKINSKLYGGDHQQVATDMSNLAEVLLDKGDFDSAGPLVQRALEIRLRSLGPAHADVGQSLFNLSRICRAKGNGKKAEQFQTQAKDIWRRAYGSDSGNRASSADTSRLPKMKNGQMRLRTIFVEQRRSRAKQEQPCSHAARPLYWNRDGMVTE